MSTLGADARAALQARALDKAEALFSELVRQEPAGEQGHLGLVDVAVARNDIANALANVLAARNACGDAFAVRLKHAFVLRRAERYAEALEVLAPLEAESGNSIAVVLEVAANQRALEQYEAAAARYKAALAIEPKHKGSLIGLIDCRAALGDLEGALVAAGEALDLLPGDVELTIKLAGVLRELGRHDEAEDALVTCLESHPSALPVRFELVRLYRQQERLRECRTQFEEVLKIDPKNRPAWNGLVDLAIHRKEFEDAGKLARRGLEIYPGDLGFEVKVGQSLHAGGDLAAATSHFEMLFDKHPKNADVLLWLLTAAIIAGNHDVYRQYMPRLDELSPQSVGARMRLAGAANSAGQWVICEEQCHSILALDERHIDARILLSRTRIATLDLAQADALIEDVLADNRLQADQRTRALATKANALQARGELRAAIKCLEEARLYSPRNLGLILEIMNCAAAGNFEGVIEPFLDELSELARPNPMERAALLLTEFGRIKEAIDLAQKWSFDFPELPWLPSLVAALWQLDGRLLEKTPVGCAQFPEVLRRPNRFAHILGVTARGEYGKGMRESGPIPGSNPRVAAVAWSVYKGDLPYEEWHRRAMHATHTWYEYQALLNHAPEHLDAFADYVDPVDYTPLEAYLDSDKPCFIVSTHLGAPAVVWALSTQIPRFHYIGGWASKVSDYMQTPYRTLMTGIGGLTQTRQISRFVAKGGMLGGMPDAPLVFNNPAFASGYTYGKMCGQPFRISNMMARLAYRRSVPTFWAEFCWRDGRIVPRIEKLDVGPREMGEAAWLAAWAQAYMNKLEPIATGEPENVSLWASMWRYLTCAQKDVGELD